MLAVTAALTVSGCSSAASAASTVGASGRGASGSGAPAISQAEAQRAFDHYVAVTNAAATSSAGKTVLPVLTGVEQDNLDALLGSHSVVVPQSATTPDAGAYSRSLSISSLHAYTYRRPTFYLPEQAGYPKFFVAYSTRSEVGTSTADGYPAWVGGVRVPLDGPVLMLFTQESAGSSWKLASVAHLPAGTTMPALAKDASGNVPQVSLSSSALLIRPSDVGALQAAVVDEGTANAASRVVASGPLTTGLYQSARGHTGIQVPSGDIYQWTLEGTTLPAFALRTADGGALVFYAMTLNTTIAVPDVINKADPIHPGQAIQVPVGVLPLLPTGSPTSPKEQLQAEETLSFAAIDPTGATGKVSVLAIGGGLTSASAS